MNNERNKIEDRLLETRTLLKELLSDGKSSNPTWDEKVDLLTEAATLNGKISAYKEALRILDGIV